MCIRSSKAGSLYRSTALGRKPERRFKAVRRAKHGVRLLHATVKSRYLVWARCGPLLIRTQQTKTVLIKLVGLLDRVRLGRKRPEATDIHCENVVLGFAFDHPLRQRERDSTSLAESGHDSATRPVIRHASHRAYQRIAVGGERKRPVYDAPNSRVGYRRKSLEAIQQLGFKVVQSRLE